MHRHLRLHQEASQAVAAAHQEDSPVAASAVHQEEDGKMKKVLALLVVMSILLAGCTAPKNVSEAAYGVGRNGFTSQTSW